jgi:uncharacterized SAM-dependent methyltransferase
LRAVGVDFSFAPVLDLDRGISDVIGDRAFTFRQGETIHTENSCKYSIAEFQELARKAGFVPQAWWTDARDWFSVHYLTAPE